MNTNKAPKVIQKTFGALSYINQRTYNTHCNYNRKYLVPSQQFT